MEKSAQPRSLRITLKVKSNKNLNKDPTAVDRQNNVAKDADSPETHQPCIEKNSSQDQEKLTSPEVIDDNGTENEEILSSVASNQLNLYDSAANDGQAGSDPDLKPVGYRFPSLSRPHPFSDQTPRILPSVGAYTVQCAKCFKWRVIPTKEKYEEIREYIIEQPFICEMAREWRPEISCANVPDIMQDGSRLWAIDKPSIPQPPPGWERLLRIRGEGSSKFADVYYVAPSQKRLRSMVEVQRLLEENPEYEGLSLSQFSFQTPRPLHENYVRKRPARALTDDTPKVAQIGWGSLGLDADLKHGVHIAKKKRSMSFKKKYNGYVRLDRNVVNVAESD